MDSPDRLRHSFGALLGIELRTVGLAIRREALLALTAFAVVCVLTAVTAIRYGDRLDLVPEILHAALPVALVLPWIVWKGDPVFGRSVLWTLPVRRQRAAAAKVAAGALWLMLAVAIALLGLSLTALATGGGMGVETVRLVGPPSAGLAGATPIPWSTPWWTWLMPFGGALLFYLAASAALLGLRHPIRWVAGAASAVALLVVIAVNLGSHGGLADSLERLHIALIHGPYGLDFALNAGEDSLLYEIERPGPGSHRLWRELPTFGGWAAAILVWLAGALLALALAIRRHWER